MEDLAARIAKLSPEKLAELARQLRQPRSTATGTAGPQRRANPAAPAPLSFDQQRLWFLDQLEPGSAAYNIPAAVRLTGALDVAALAASLNEVVRRHEILRTTFQTASQTNSQTAFQNSQTNASQTNASQTNAGQTNAGQTNARMPQQVVQPVLQLPLPVTDLRALPPAERRAEAWRLAAELARQPFDLTQGPLLRAQLFALAEAEFLLLYVVHHIVADGPSCQLLGAEIAALYQQARAGQPLRLPELPLQFADFAVWQRAQLTEAVRVEQETYWRATLAGAPWTVAWPAWPDGRRASAAGPLRSPDARGAVRVWAVPEPLAVQVQELCRRERVTLFVFLLAAFAALLQHATAQPEFVIGTDVSKRDWPETQRLIGFFVDQLPLRVDTRGAADFQTLLGRARQIWLDAYAHRDLPFDWLVRAVNPQRLADHAPLFQVKLALQTGFGAAPAWPDAVAEPLELGNGFAQLDLIVNLTHSATTLGGAWEYNADLFDEATIAHWQTAFAAILQTAARDLSVSLTQLNAELDALAQARQRAAAEQLRALSRHKFQRRQQVAPESAHER